MTAPDHAAAPGAAEAPPGAGLVRYRSQRLAQPYFVAAALLFALQVVFGLLIAAQYVWPTFLLGSVPFNVGRAIHLNLLVFWLLLGLMGASYYLVPEESGREIFSEWLGRIQLGILLVAGVATLVGVSMFRDSLGKPFTESPMPWPWFIALGVALFLVNIGATLMKARRWNAITLVLFVGMVSLAALYVINIVTAHEPNLTVDFFWWWWVIHLWVEGAWELVAAAVMAWILIEATGVERGRISRWLYAEVALVLVSGIIGIGHHYYWIGTPRYWLFWGALFSAFEPLPIAMMAYDALHGMSKRRTAAANPAVLWWIGGTAIGHFVGAGLWGFAMTLPQTNRWTHGTLVTASHGHFAFFGAFASLVLAAIYLIAPRLRGWRSLPAGRGVWSFWLMTLGMLAMVGAFTVAGLLQVYLVRMAGLDFMTVRVQYLAFWMFWVWLSGAIMFLPGVLLFLRDFLAPRAPAEATALAPGG